MKTIKIISCILIVSGIFHGNSFAQKVNRPTNQYAVRAITKAVEQYMTKKRVGENKNYLIVTLKLMKINKISGEFVLNFLISDTEYTQYLKPTYYVKVDSKLVLIVFAKSCKVNPEYYGINKITPEIEQEALKIVTHPYDAITVETTPYMVFKYKKDSINGVYYRSPPFPKKKYWF